MKVLVTGITGFVGSHMADYLLQRGDCEVFGIKRWSSRLRNVRHMLNDVELYDCDLVDYTSGYHMLDHFRPDRIFHIAAQSFVSPSWNMPALYFDVNIKGTLNILESFRHLNLDPLMHVAGSGEEYGLVYENEVPIKEDNQLRPVNPYAVSKVGQSLLCYEHFKSYGQRIVRTRAFNNIGPRRDKVFAFASFAYQIAMMEQKGAKRVIRVGRTDARRDYTHVHDVVRAYWLALDKGEPGEVYCVGANNIYTVQEGLDYLISLAKVKGIKVVRDAKLVRPTEVPLLISDSSKFKKQTGWEPEISFEDTMKDILEYWRTFVREGWY